MPVIFVIWQKFVDFFFLSHIICLCIYRIVCFKVSRFADDCMPGKFFSVFCSVLSEPVNFRFRNEDIKYYLTSFKLYDIYYRAQITGERKLIQYVIGISVAFSQHMCSILFFSCFALFLSFIDFDLKCYSRTFVPKDVEFLNVKYRINMGILYNFQRIFTGSAYLFWHHIVHLHCKNSIWDSVGGALL